MPNSISPYSRSSSLESILVDESGLKKADTNSPYDDLSFSTNSYSIDDTQTKIDQENQITKLSNSTHSVGEKPVGTTGQLEENTMNSKETTEETTGVIEFEGHKVIIETNDVLKSWKLKLQMIACFLSLMIAGMMDQSLGSNIEKLVDYYNSSRTKVSNILICQVVGYLVGSAANEPLHKLIGMHWLSVLEVFCVMLDCIVLFCKAPLAVLCVFAVVQGFGEGSIDCTLTLFVGKLKYPNQLLGIMHGFYGLGCLVSPLMVVAFTNKGWSWNVFYGVLFLIAAFTMLLCLVVFFRETKWKYRYIEKIKNDQNENDPTLKKVILNKWVLFIAGTLFLYLGSELCVGIWFWKIHYGVCHWKVV
ncbi:unnamed protein product [Ambrosiozyma monospora]|uniref:Unnamed protein product n=1 Tax=Ambrosiozyma monospora TaxID=43982 RepID=A0ACB5T7P6_AMBMO|nr:unnamed protein product [Ambrosiozyma monospora]